MEYFSDLAKNLPAGIVDHPFYAIIERAYPEGTEDREDRRAMLALKTFHAESVYEKAVRMGDNPDMAREQALANVMPEAPAFEQWEIEDAEEEQASIIGELFPKWPVRQPTP